MTWFTTACVVIEDGEVGVTKSFGAIRDEPLPQGAAFVVPVARQVETWNVKLQELTETAQVPSSEGLIVRSTLSDSYLHYLWIKTLNENPNVIYVASEANTPIFKSVGAK